MKKAVAVGAISASLLGGAAVGALIGAPSLVSAQDETTTTEAPADVPAAPLPDQEPGQWVRGALDELVQDGTITAEQADAVAAKLDEKRPARPGRHGGPGGPGGHHGRGPGGGMDAAATAIGIEPQELFEAMRNGSTVAQVAQEHGVDVQVVIDAMVAEMNTHLDEEVAEGELTQEEADARKAEAVTRITEMVNNPMPERPEGGPKGRGGHHDDDAPADDTTEEQPAEQQGA